MGFLTLFLLVGVPYVLFRYGLKIDGPLALASSLLISPFAAYGLMAIAGALGMSGTGAMGLVLIVGSFYVGIPLGLVLLVTHWIFWRKRP